MPKKNIQDVRQRLLSVGLKLFAEKGFASATVREICDAANSNLAAINYYFRDKAGYYEEVSAYAEGLRRQELQKLLSANPDGDPWDLLACYVDTLLDNAYDNEMFLAAWFFMREFLNQGVDADPSRYKQLTDNRHRFEKHISLLMSNILGEAATEQNVALLHYTYVSLSLYLVIEANMMKDSSSSLQLIPRVNREHLRNHIVGLVRFAADRMKTEYAEEKARGNIGDGDGESAVLK